MAMRLIINPMIVSCSNLGSTCIRGCFPSKDGLQELEEWIRNIWTISSQKSSTIESTC